MPTRVTYNGKRQHNLLANPHAQRDIRGPWNRDIKRGSNPSITNPSLEEAPRSTSLATVASPKPLYKVLQRDGSSLPKEELKHPHRSLGARDAGGRHADEIGLGMQDAGHEERGPELGVGRRVGAAGDVQHVDERPGEGVENLRCESKC